MTNTASRSLVHTVAQLLLVIVCAAIAATLYVSGATPAQAATPVQAVCTTDLDCAAWELQQVERHLSPLYVTIHEDLSFAGSSALYSAKNDLLADAFWADHVGQDWDEAKWDLARWLDQYRSA